MQQHGPSRPPGPDSAVLRGAGRSTLPAARRRSASGRLGGQTRGGISTGWDLARGIAGSRTRRSTPCGCVASSHTAEIVDAYQLACHPVRDVIVRYMQERRPALDYSTFSAHTRVLASFWADLEAHHPGIERWSPTSPSCSRPSHEVLTVTLSRSRPLCSTIAVSAFIACTRWNVPQLEAGGVLLGLAEQLGPERRPCLVVEALGAQGAQEPVAG